MTILPRDEWLLDPDLIHLNHGSFGACPRSILREQRALRSRVERNASRFFLSEAPELWQKTRHKLSEFLNADPDGLVFVNNATTGVNAVLQGIDFRSGDEILIFGDTYPACRNAAAAALGKTGGRLLVQEIPFPPQSADEIVDLVLSQITERTRLAIVDAVASPTAIRMPFERLTEALQSRGVDVLLDAAHGPGLVDLDLSSLGAAYVTGNCHKWLYAPKGSAFLHVRSDRIDGTQALVVSHGWGSGETGTTRFQALFAWQGTQDPTPWLAVPFAIDFMASSVPGGWDGIRERSHALAVTANQILCDRLKIMDPVAPGLLAAMATIRLRGKIDEGPRDALSFNPLAQRLLDDFGIQVIAFPTKKADLLDLRISAALYNSEHDYVRLAEALEQIGVSPG